MSNDRRKQLIQQFFGFKDLLKVAGPWIFDEQDGHWMRNNCLSQLIAYVNEPSVFAGRIYADREFLSMINVYAPTLQDAKDQVDSVLIQRGFILLNEGDENV